MSHKTKQEVLAKLRRQYLPAVLPYKRQRLDQAVALLGYHRKAALRALRARPAPPRTLAVVRGRPREYDPQKLLPVLKPIWFAALQPCGSRRVALQRRCRFQHHQVRLISPSARWRMGGSLFVGSNGAFSTLVVSNGASAASVFGYLGQNASSSNNLAGRCA